MTTSWLIAFTFEAENATEAENIAAAYMDNIPERGGLSYRDPITGRWVLWAEPIRRLDTLRDLRLDEESP